MSQSAQIQTLESFPLHSGPPTHRVVNKPWTHRVVNKPWGTHTVCYQYLAREDVTKGTEGIIQSLVVNGLVQVLDEDVTYTRAA